MKALQSSSSFGSKFVFMRKIIPGVLSLLACLPAFGQLSLVPAPAHTVVKTGTFILTPQTRISAAMPFRQTAALLASGASIATIPAGGAIRFEAAAATDTLGEEGYRLSVTPKNITVRAQHARGAFYGSQTLLQLLAIYGKNIPCAEIADKPRFGYRGLHLDVSRNFYPIEFIRKTIDLMALYKLNTFHWHLTDGAGWRLEIKQYPELTRQAAWRYGTSWKEWRDRGVRMSREGNPNASGGYYTQEQAKDIVRYAAERGITVLPEIEMPGHSEEVLAVYPELSCSGVPYKESDFCVANPAVFTFLENVLTEVMAIFPSKYIHIGGDEAGKEAWKTSAACQELMKKEGYTSVDQLQSYFIRKIEKFVNSKGRRIIGWDEILEGGLAPDATVMSWRGEKGGIEAARQKHHVIMTPGGYCYFDFYQANPLTQPEAIGGFLPLEKVYSYEPIPAGLTAEEGKYILGAQANVWTEYIPTTEHAEYMIFPRLLALAEVVWSPKTSRNWPDFQQRMQAQFGLLQKKGVNYCRPSYDLTIRPVFANGKATVTLLSEQYQPEIHYTTDGTKPTLSSPKYTRPFEVAGSAVITASVFEDGQAKGTPATLPIDFHKAIGKKVTYRLPASKGYPAQGEATLTNGYRGGLTYGDGQWQGFEGKDMDVVIDMGESTALRSLSAGFMQLTGPGVYMPASVTVSLSDDGQTFGQELTLPNDVPENDPKLAFKSFAFDLSGKRARYLRIQAVNKQRGFLFCDEIIVY